MRRTIALLAISLLASVESAAAQIRTVTGQVTSGSATAEVFGSLLAQLTTFELSGADFRVAGVGEGGPGVFNTACTHEPICKPGFTLDFDAVFLDTEFGIGVVTVNGETLEPAYFSGNFAFRTDPSPYRRETASG